MCQRSLVFQNSMNTHISICNLLDLSQERGSGSGIPITTETWSDPLAGEAALLVVSDEPLQ